MIDCNITTNYLTERYRMTQKGKLCKVCYGTECPLCAKNNGVGITCVELESSYPEKAISIVQRWSDEHPQRTYLSEFLEHYPNASLHDDGTPHLCPSDLGWNDSRKCREQSNCVECWSQIIPIEEDEE